MLRRTYVVAVRGTQYVLIDTRTGEVTRPAYGTRKAAERACNAANAANA